MIWSYDIHKTLARVSCTEPNICYKCKNTTYRERITKLQLKKICRNPNEPWKGNSVTHTILISYKAINAPRFFLMSCVNTPCLMPWRGRVHALRTHMDGAEGRRDRDIIITAANKGRASAGAYHCRFPGKDGRDYRYPPSPPLGRCKLLSL